MPKTTRVLIGVLALVMASGAYAAFITEPGLPAKVTWTTGSRDAPIVFDTLHVYGFPYRRGTIRDVAIGSHFKGSGDDTVRFATTMSGSPRYVLLMNDTTAAAPLKRDSLGWRRHVTTATYFDSSSVGYHGLGVGDVNADGRTDIVYGRYSAPYAIFRGWWDGSAWQRESLPIAPLSGATHEVAIGDADNNDTNEIFLNGGRTLYRLSYSGGVWSRDSFYVDAATCYGIAIGDFDTAYAGNEVAVGTYDATFARLRWTGSAWDLTTIFNSGSVGFYDLAIGDWDPNHVGNEVAVNNGYGYSTYGNFFLFSGAGSSWTLTQLQAYTAWSSYGEIAIGDILDTHAGNEIVAVPGGATGQPIAVYPEGGAWWATGLPGPGGTAYGLAIGNVNKWRTSALGSQELVIAGNTQIFEYEQRLLGAADVAVSDLDFPGSRTAVAGKPVTVQIRLRNTGTTTQTSIPLRYQFGANPVVNETWTGSLPCGAYATHTFATTYTPTAQGAIAFQAWSDLSGDAYRLDDTVSYGVQVFATGTVVGQLFNNVQFPPIGWQAILEPSASINWTKDSVSRYPTGYVPVEGPYMARYACFNQGSPYGARLWSHKFTMGATAKDCSLDFWMLNTNSYASYYDSLYVEYSGDSLTWTPVAGFRAYDAANPGWNKKQVKVGSFPAGGYGWIAFRSRSNYNHDIDVDSVRAYEATLTGKLNDVGVSRIIFPLPPYVVNTPVPVKVRITNFGVGTQTSIPVSYAINGGTPVSETWTGSLPGLSSLIYTFTQSYTPTDTTPFAVWAGTGLSSDEDLLNDSTSLPARRVCIEYHVAPYLESFDGAWTNDTMPPFCGWRIINGGTDTLRNNNDWHRYVMSSPARTTANISFSPVEWSNDWLISPRFNCADAGTYNLGFWHFYSDYNPSSPDSGRILVSVDGGAAWTKLDMYANADDSGYKSFDVSTLASGQDDVRFAFNYVANDEMSWNVDDFTLGFIALAPVLIAPANGGVIGDTTPLCDWNDAAGATRYRFQLAANDSFNPVLVDDSTLVASEFQTLTALTDGRYYWRARAGTGVAWGPWAAAWSFDVDATAPSTPTLYAPANHSSSTNTLPTFVWGSATFGTDAPISYRIRAYSDTTGAPVFDAATADTTFTPSTALSQGVYYWHVMARDTAGNSGDWSGWFDFTIRLFAPGWARMADVPAGSKNKNVKDGGSLAGGIDKDTVVVYALKGNNRYEFYEFNTATNTWYTKDSIPAIGRAGKKKAVKKGATLAWAPRATDGSEGAVYAAKGNNTLEYWEYYPETDGGWTQKADVPTGAKNLKEGTGSAVVKLGDTTYVYLLRGAGSFDFHRYNTVTNTWQNMAPAPGGTSGKPYKNGSAICVSADGKTIYALKGSYNEFFSYSVDSNRWESKRSVPFIGTSGKKKKVKDGAGLAHMGGRVWAVKGGNTIEFWQYVASSDTWYQKENLIPSPKNVKGGGALTYAGRGLDQIGNDGLYALMGNNTLVFEYYPETDKLPLAEVRVPANALGAAFRTPHAALRIVPNPFRDLATITYSLPRSGNVNLKLYDITGKLVTILAEGYHPAGSSSFIVHRSSFSSGIYILKLATDASTTTTKLVIE